MPSPSPFPAVEPDEDGVYHVYSLCYAKGRERRVVENFLRRDAHDGPMPIDFNLWIVRNARRTILVDSGFSPRQAVERGRPLDFDPLEALSRLAIDPNGLEDEP